MDSPAPPQNNVFKPSVFITHWETILCFEHPTVALCNTEHICYVTRLKDIVSVNIRHLDTTLTESWTISNNNNQQIMIYNNGDDDVVVVVVVDDDDDGSAASADDYHYHNKYHNHCLSTFDMF